MKKLVCLVLLTSFVLANPFALTKQDRETIHNSYDNKKIIVRYERFNKFLKDATQFDTIKKLNRVNSFINKILPASDKKAQNTIEHWSTPKEFLINGKGDCEDYAITKYFTLLQLGIKKEKLYLAIVKVRGKKTMHMVLLYFQTPKSTPLILDNLSWRVLPLNKRKTLKVRVIFNEIDAHLLEHNKLAKRVNIDWGEFNRWEDILDKVRKNK